VHSATYRFIVIMWDVYLHGRKYKNFGLY